MQTRMEQPDLLYELTSHPNGIGGFVAMKQIILGTRISLGSLEIFIAIDNPTSCPLFLPMLDRGHRLSLPNLSFYSAFCCREPRRQANIFSCDNIPSVSKQDVFSQIARKSASKLVVDRDWLSSHVVAR